MGSKNKGVSGLLSGAAAGSSIMPGWGTAIGAGLGFLAGEATGGEAPEQVQQVDPAFLNSLYNQSMGTEKTAADMKMKAAFDQTLAQQVAAARSARGVNPALLQRNVARLASEQGAKAVGAMAEANLVNQDNARSRYLQALNMNQQVQAKNIENTRVADERDQKQLGSLINSAGAIGATFTTAKGADNPYKGENAVKEEINTGGLTLSDTPATAQSLNSQYTLGANQQVPQYDMSSKSDVRAKTKIKKEDMVVVSDERQKDLIKNESLPQNGNMGMQNQQAMQPQGGQQVPPMGAFAQPQQAPQAPMTAPQAPAATPAPMAPSQTALEQANLSSAKGGTIGDLQMKENTLQAPSEGPTAQELLQMSMSAQRNQTRDVWGNVKKSDKENYAEDLSRWYANQAKQREAFTKETADLNTSNAAVDVERQARLSKFYTGNTNTNANDLAARYALPKTVMPSTDWGAAQQAQRNAGIGDQSRGYDYGRLAKEATRLTLPGVGLPAAGLISRSDERSKENINTEASSVDGEMNPKSFLDKLTAYSYEYKQGQKQNPNAGEGRHLSVMAQDLEKAGPVGQSMVDTDPKSGMKQVDYGKGFGVILAAQAQLNERLKQIEAKKGKV